MSTIVDNSVKSYIATAAIGAYLRVKKDGTTQNVVIAGAEKSFGVTVANADAGKGVTVRFQQSPGTAFYKAANPIVANAAVYGAANGLVDDVATADFIGYAEEAATATGDIIEVRHGTLPVS